MKLEYARSLVAAMFLAALLPAAAVAAKDDTTIVSQPTGVEGMAGNAASQSPSVSADGRFVAFASWASNLDPADGDDASDVFVRDVVTGTTMLVSRASGSPGDKGDGASFHPDISGDGRYVAFASRAANLDPADDDEIADIFVRDLQAGTTRLVSRAAGSSGTKGNGASYSPSIADDGHRVTFDSEASNLDPAGDADADQDVFVRDMTGDTTALVSRASGLLGDGGNGYSSWSRISGDGRYVAFGSRASNLDPADSDEGTDVFVRDLGGAVTMLVSRASGVGGAHGSAWSDLPDISADGRHVTFTSLAPNLAPGDGDELTDVFVRDLVTHATTLVSRASGDSGAKADGHSFVPRISADGTRVAFMSGGTNLDPVDGGASGDIYVRLLASATTTLVSRKTGFAGAKADGESFHAYISGDGTSVAFCSTSTNLDPNGDTSQDVFVRDLDAGTTGLVSRASGTAGAKGRSTSSTLSHDGRFVAFESYSALLDPADTDTAGDVLLRDRQAGSTTLVSRASGALGAKADGESESPVISGDGGRVAFASFAGNLDPADGDDSRDVFVRDLKTAATTLVSRTSGLDGAKGDSYSGAPDLSADGRHVAFHSAASNLAATGPAAGNQVFVRDLQDSTTTLVSRAHGPAGEAANANTTNPAISADGRYVAFESGATNLDPADGDDTLDVFVRDLRENTTRLISRSTSGTKGNGESRDPDISGSGRYVVFASAASNLHGADGDTREDVYIHDLLVNSTALVSRTISGLSAGNDSFGPAISRDARSVAFSSTATNLDTADGDPTSDVFMRDLLFGSTTLVSRASGPAGTKGDDVSFGHAVSGDGRFVSFESQATNLDPADKDPIRDVFVRDVLGPPQEPPPPPPPLPPPPLPPPPPSPPPPLSTPASLDAPSISGRAIEGRRLSCARGRWTGAAPMTYRVDWLRNGRKVGAGGTRRVTGADVSRQLRCRVTASNPAGSAAAASPAIRPRADVVVIRVSGGLAPRPDVAPATACRGSMTLTLLDRRRVLGRGTVRVRLRGADCRWSWEVRVRRTKLGDARTLTLEERFSGNAVHYAGTSTEVLRRKGGRWMKVRGA